MLFNLISCKSGETVCFWNMLKGACTIHCLLCKIPGLHLVPRPYPVLLWWPRFAGSFGWCTFSHQFQQSLNWLWNIPFVLQLLVLSWHCVGTVWVTYFNPLDHFNLLWSLICCLPPPLSIPPPQHFLMSWWNSSPLAYHIWFWNKLSDCALGDFNVYLLQFTDCDSWRSLSCLFFNPWSDDYYYTQTY